jgi:hypothetical protein
MEECEIFPPYCCLASIFFRISAFYLLSFTLNMNEGLIENEHKRVENLIRMNCSLIINFAKIRKYLRVKKLPFSFFN